MKILYISKSIIPSRTANSINVMKMCQAFEENGHQTILLTPNIKNKYEKNIENIHDFYGVKKKFKIIKLWHPNIKFGSIIYSLSILIYMCFNKNFDLVYGRFLHGCYIAILLRKIVIFESHESVIDMPKNRLLVFKKFIKNKYLKKIVVISEQLKKTYVDFGILDTLKIKVAHDGSDEVKNFNNKVNLLGDNTKLKVGYIGHLYKGKGMEIIHSISKQLNDIADFHIVGGTEKDISWWQKKTNHKNVFFYGHIPHKLVTKYINTLDICLLPNQKIVLAHGAKDNGVNISQYTSPLKLFEYMSHKKPIIASDLPVIREVLNENNSLLVDCEDIEEWIRSIIILKDKKKRDTLANQALIDSLNYTWKNRASLIIEN